MRLIRPIREMAVVGVSGLALLLSLTAGCDSEPTTPKADGTTPPVVAPTTPVRGKGVSGVTKTPKTGDMPSPKMIEDK